MRRWLLGEKRQQQMWSDYCVTVEERSGCEDSHVTGCKNSVGKRKNLYLMHSLTLTQGEI